MFRRRASFFENRFHEKQENSWYAYKAGMTVVLPAGRRSGKSEFFCECLIEDVENYGKPCLYLASTQESAREIMWPKMRERIKHVPGWRFNEARLEAVYKSYNAPIRFRGIEQVDNLAGKAYRLVIADEYALWKKDAKTIVKQILAPMIADYDGLIMYGSSKRGKNHLWDLHEHAKLNPEKYFVQEMTIFDNPFVSESGRQKLLSEYSGQDDPLYRQEVLNEYVVLEGMAFALDESTFTCDPWPTGEMEHCIHYRGLDHGFNPDPTACLWMAYSFKHKHFIVYNEYKESKLLLKQHTDAISGMEGYDIRNSISDVDPQIIAEYNDLGLVLQPADKYDKKARILRIVNALRMGKLKIAKNCTKLLKEMQNYVWGQDGNDHLIDSLIYVYTNTEVPTKPKPPEPEEYRRSDYNQRYSQESGFD